MRRLLAASLLAFLPALAPAAGTTAGATLRRPVSARGAGMGDALTALRSGTDAFAANPAGLGSDRPEARTLFSHGSVEDSFGFVGAVVPWRGAALAAALAYYDAGKIVAGTPGAQ